MGIIMKEQIMNILADSIGTDVALLDTDANPAEDYNMDSIAILDFVIRIEDEYGIDFQDFSDLSNHMKTIDEMVVYMIRKIGGNENE